MRKIKFRGYEKTSKSWVVGGIGFEYGNRDKTYITHSYNVMISVDSSSVGQLTPFTDKKDNKIWEGDILEDAHGARGYVVFDDGAFALKSHGSEAIDYEHSSEYKKLTIIGNVYEDFERLLDSDEHENELLEKLTEHNANVVSNFIDHLKEQTGYIVPDRVFETYFNA